MQVIDIPKLIIPKSLKAIFLAKTGIGAEELERSKSINPAYSILKLYGANRFLNETHLIDNGLNLSCNEFTSYSPVDDFKYYVGDLASALQAQIVTQSPAGYTCCSPGRYTVNKNIVIPSNVEILYLDRIVSTEIDGFDTNQLKYLGISAPNLKSIKNLKLRNIQTLHLNSVHLDDFSEIKFEDNSLSALYIVNSGLETADLVKISLKNIFRTTNKAYPGNTLDLSQNKITSLSNIDLPANLDHLNLIGNSIDSIEDISFPINLQSLNLSYNKLKVFSGVNLPESLTKLDLRNNTLQKLKDLKLPNALTRLLLTANRLESFESVEFPNNTELKISLSNNELESEDLSSLPVNVRDIDLSDNKLGPVVDLSKFVNAVNITMNNNPIQQIIGLENLTKLERLEILGTEVKQADLKLPNNDVKVISDESATGPGEI